MKSIVLSQRFDPFMAGERASFPDQLADDMIARGIGRLYVTDVPRPVTAQPPAIESRVTAEPPVDEPLADEHQQAPAEPPADEPPPASRLRRGRR